MNYTQSELKNYTRQVIDSIGVCESIKVSFPEHFDFFNYLFERHERYPEKFKDMCDIMIRRKPGLKQQIVVYILKNDGSEDDVSVMNKCITGRSDNLSSAMRNSIMPQILEFKQVTNHLCTSCRSNQNLEVDHKSPEFIELKERFLEETKLPIPNSFDDNLYHSKVFREQDASFKDDWNTYHLKNAVLQFLCKTCHNKKKPVVRRKKSRKFDIHPYQKSQKTSENKR